MKYLIVVIFILGTCSDQEERNRNVTNLQYVCEGDTPIEVVHKMEKEPDIIEISEPVWFDREERVDITTFTYFTPKGSSSEIIIYIKDCEVIYIYFDG